MLRPTIEKRHHFSRRLLISVSNRSTQSRLLFPHRPARHRREPRLHRAAGTANLPATRLHDFSHITDPRRHPHPQLRRPYLSHCRGDASALAELTSIENTIAGFAQSFTTNELTFNRATGNEVDTQTLCLTSGPTDTTPICITKAQLAALLSAAGASQTTKSVSQAEPSNSSSTFPESVSPDTPPVIQINGDNPAIVQVGDSYNDLGATITGPQADLNLGIETYINGVETSPVQIDTSQAATDTIDYVATDQNGLTSTSTRTVIIDAPSIVPTDDASTTDATSTTTAQ